MPSRAFTSAPNFSRTRTASGWPAIAARCSAVTLSLSPTCGSNPHDEHRLQHHGLSGLRRAMHHQVMLGAQLGSQARPGVEDRRRRRSIAARARGDELFDRGQLALRAIRDEPRRNIAVAVELRQRVRRAPVRPAAHGVGAVLDQQLDHRHVPPPRRDVQRRFPFMAPRKIRIRAVFDQPARPGGIGAPEHHVDERRHAAGNPVHVHAETVQQLERRDIAAATGDVDGHAVGGIGAGVEQHFGERQMADGAHGRPQRRARQLRMPVPVVLRIRIRAERAQPPRDRDQSVHASRSAGVHAGVARIEQRLPVLRSTGSGRELRMVGESRLH